MEILLIENVRHLGHRGDVVTVKDGYARNFLLPRKMALPVTAGNKRQIELEKERNLKLRAKELAQAKNLAERLAEVVVKTTKKVGETGTLFGSVTNAEIADLLKAKGFEIDRHAIHVEHIKTLGTYSVEIRLLQGVIAQIKLEVVAPE